jgi:hypothetical protein
MDNSMKIAATSVDIMAPVLSDVMRPAGQGHWRLSNPQRTDAPRQGQRDHLYARVRAASYEGIPVAASTPSFLPSRKQFSSKYYD